MDRRSFMKAMSLTTGAMLAADLVRPVAAETVTGSEAPAGAGNPAKTVASQPAATLESVSRLKAPVAIAMWDFSWLLRHDRCQGFGNWDAALDGLVARGYNAIRIDVFPNLVAAGPDGKVIEEFYYPRGDWKPAMWGSQYSTHIRPREALLEFLPKCTARGIHVGFSSWFFGPGSEKIEGLDGFVRVWDETLHFLDQHGLLNNVLYVDLLNEYPLFHGFAWLTNQMKALETPATPKADTATTATATATTATTSAATGAAPLKEVFQWGGKPGIYNTRQVAFYRQFMTDAITRLSERWPGLDFFSCQSKVDDAPWQQMDFSRFHALDVHLWFVMNELLSGKTGYWEQIHGLAPSDQGFPEVNRKLLANWTANKDKLIGWMDAEMAQVAGKGKALGVPIGNTEGWGIINWLDHPALDWTIIKEAAEICARLGRKHGYAFNCTSNFTHPHFAGYWDDIEWHKRVTGIIREG